MRRRTERTRGSVPFGHSREHSRNSGRIDVGPGRESAGVMPRLRRIQDPDLVRHVMARGNARQTIFHVDVDYRYFMFLLARTLEEFAIECWNYCLMPNHYHVMLRPTLPNLSAAMCQLNGGYARWLNTRYERVGHVFQGRFKAQIVQREGYPLALSRYIALNPVRARLVERPEQWTWSSYAAVIGLQQTPPFLLVDSTLGLLGEDDRATLQARFTEFVMTEPEDGMLDHRIRSREDILGDRPFKAWVRNGADAQRSGKKESGD